MSTERRGAHRPKRSLGQNFLVDQNLQKKIVEAIEPAPTDEVLEIGPGTGALTRHLAGAVSRLILVELDDDLAASLAAEYRNSPSVEVVHRDVLALDLDDVTADPSRLKVIGNIPYNVTTPIVFHLLERHPRPALIVLMMQQEVAERILAPPGSRTYGALAVGVQAVADVERVLNVRRTAFRPVPQVDSTVLRIRPRIPTGLQPDEEHALRVLTRIAFGRRRKQFQRTLRDAFGLSTGEISELEASTGFDLTRRPEAFTPAEFITLARALPIVPGG